MAKLYRGIGERADQILNNFSLDLIVQLDSLALSKIFLDIPELRLVNAQLLPLLRRHVHDIALRGVIVVPLYRDDGHVEVQFLLPVLDVVHERSYVVTEHI